MSILDGRVALVTGAGRGIGREEAMLLARLGASVVVNDVGGDWSGQGTDRAPAEEVVAEIRSAGGHAVANGDDVSDFDGAERMVRQAIEEYGQLDVVVNNAGILRDRMIFNMTAEDFDAVIAVHLRGHFATMRHACSYWRQQAKKGEEVVGRIINTSSGAGLFAQAGQANYSAAKAGIAAITQSVSEEMMRYGVTVNAICPAAATRLTLSSGTMDSRDSHRWDPLDPANVAPLVAFLASDAASDVTGHVFGVWGGVVELYESWRQGDGILRTEPGPFSVEELVERKEELFCRARPTFVSRMSYVASQVNVVVERERRTGTGTTQA